MICPDAVKNAGIGRHAPKDQTFGRRKAAITDLLILVHRFSNNWALYAE